MENNEQPFMKAIPQLHSNNFFSIERITTTSLFDIKYRSEVIEVRLEIGNKLILTKEFLTQALSMLEQEHENKIAKII